MALPGPILPADKRIQDIADKVRATVEERIGIKFEVFRVLIYRVTPSGQGSDGCYHIKIVTIEDKESIHIVVHANSAEVEVKHTVVAIQTELDIHAPLEKLHVFGHDQKAW